MKQLLKAMAKLTERIDVMVSNETFGDRKPRPLRCHCGLRFLKTSTWLPHWRKAHPRLAKRYDKAEHADRVNLLLVMMRRADAGR